MPFTQAEAEEIWDDFEDLKDTEFKRDSPTVFLVLDIVISPFNDDDKQAFIDRYSQIKDGREALSSYVGSEYDVLLVACDVNDETDLAFIDINTFAAEKGIKYNFPQKQD